MADFWTLVTLGEACRTRFFRVQFSKPPLALLIRIFSSELSERFSLDFSCDFSLKLPLFLRDFPFAMPSTCAGVDLNPPSRMFCCCFTVSLCLAKFVAFSRVRFGSSWSFSESSQFCNRTTILLRMSSSFSRQNCSTLPGRHTNLW